MSKGSANSRDAKINWYCRARVVPDLLGGGHCPIPNGLNFNSKRLLTGTVEGRGKCRAIVEGGSWVATLAGVDQLGLVTLDWNPASNSEAGGRSSGGDGILPRGATPLGNDPIDI